MNTSTGQVSIPAGTPAGNYTINYRICPADSVSNCANANVTITVATPAIDAVTESLSVAATGGTTTSVLANDTFNGGAPGSATTANVNLTTVGTWPSGITLNANGTITVAAGTAPSNYSLQYQICDKLNLANCDTVTYTIAVTAVINPVTESGSAAATGGTAVANVRSNDFVNGIAATNANSAITQSGTWPSGITLNTTTGAIAVANGTAPGVYSLAYRLCDLATPTANCNTVTNTITVTAVINPVTESGSAAATGGTAVTNVRSNDFVNGIAATNANSVITQSGTWPSGITLNTTTGAIAVANGTAPGVYSLAYRLCDLATPTANCNTVTNTITVTAVINPVTESGSAAATGGTAVANVRSNDFVNGIAATSANSVITQSGTWPSGITLNTTTGAIVVANGTAPGVYALAYQLCDLATPTANCNTVTNTITVTATINAEADNFTATGPQAVAGASTVGNVLTNDTLNGSSATTTTTTLSVTTPATSINGGPVPTLTIATGAIAIPAGTPAGTYNITYQLCEKVSGTPCDGATTQVIVALPSIIASSETLSTTADGGTTTSVLANDSYNGGAAGSATPINVTVSQEGTWPAGVTLNADGTITVAAGTTPGSYPLSYKICDNLNPTNCTTSTTTLNVTPTVNAVIDNFSATGTQAVGGAASIGNVLANDTFNGGAAGSATADNVAISVTTPAIPISQGAPVPTLNTTTGAIAIPAGTPAGNYSITYQVCEKVSGTPCDTATTQVTVATPAISASSETLSTTANGGTTTSVLANDSYNGGAAGSATSSNVTASQEGTWPAGVTLNADGTITVAVGTTPGSYSLDYKICDQLNPTNCTTATTTLNVTPTVNAVADNFSATGNNALDGVANVGNVLENDNLNSGAPGSATTGDVVITVSTPAVPVSSGAPVPTLDTNTGIVSIPAGTPAGLYTINYQICDEEIETLCSTAKVDIEISAATICYPEAQLDNQAGSALNTATGITSLDRAGTASTWPAVRKSGWIVLEAKTKGFVLNRVAFNANNQPVAADGTTLVITTPVEGMMVYDTTNNCLKVYTTTDGINFAWYCMETQTCPE